MAKNNRIRRRWPWITAIVVMSAVLIGLITWAVVINGPPDEPTAPTAATQQKSAGPDDIVCTDYSRFSGQFVEDGRDELVENVAAMLVTNRSDQYLDLATLTYLIDGETATFVVTGLPPGTSAWVMEANRMTIGTDAMFTRQDCVTAFREPTSFAGEVSLTADGHDLTVTNTTDRTLKDVYVYYKALHTDGNYFGGITYRVGFGDLASGAWVEKLAGHYSVDGAQVVRITWQEE